MFASFAFNDGRVIQVLGAANSTTRIITLDDHLQTFATTTAIVVVVHIDFGISCLSAQALGFVGPGQIEMF